MKNLLILSSKIEINSNRASLAYLPKITYIRRYGGVVINPYGISIGPYRNIIKSEL